MLPLPACLALQTIPSHPLARHYALLWGHAEFRVIYLQLFVLCILHFLYYIFATFCIIYLQPFILYICYFSYYIFCNFSYYIFDTFRIIYLQLSYYIFATIHTIFSTLFVLYNPLGIKKCYFRII